MKTKISVNLIPHWFLRAGTFSDSAEYENKQTLVPNCITNKWTSF